MYKLILFCKHTFFWGQGQKSYSIEKYFFEISNEFVRWFHLSRIPNLLIFLTKIGHDFFFNFQTEKKNCFWIYNKSVFFFNCSNWDKFMEKIRDTNWWKHLNRLVHHGENQPFVNWELCRITMYRRKKGRWLKKSSLHM